ncbi:hypothetical protein CCR95_23615 [Thiocystis minor]|nr:hypothetical protein [Thiocystis minor]
MTLQGGLAPGLLMRVALLAGVWRLPLGEFCLSDALSRPHRCWVYPRWHGAIATDRRLIARSIHASFP